MCRRALGGRCWGASVGAVFWCAATPAPARFQRVGRSAAWSRRSCSKRQIKLLNPTPLPATRRAPQLQNGLHLPFFPRPAPRARASAALSGEPHAVSIHASWELPPAQAPCLNSMAMIGSTCTMPHARKRGGWPLNIEASPGSLGLPALALARAQQRQPGRWCLRRWATCMDDLLCGMDCPTAPVLLTRCWRPACCVAFRCTLLRRTRGTAAQLPVQPPDKEGPTSPGCMALPALDGFT